MRENTMKQKLAAGKPVFGSMITFPSPVVVEMLGFLGYDWVLIDNEHGSITVDSAEDMIRAAEYSGTAPIVRPVGNRPEIIAPFLDRGAWGVAGAPREHRRGSASSGVGGEVLPGWRARTVQRRPAGRVRGSTRPLPTTWQTPNRNTLVCLMLEEVEAIENIPELVKVPGVDVYFIGAGDLSQSMGYPGQQTHPEVQALVEKGVQQIAAAGVTAGCSCPDNLVPHYLELGVRYFHNTRGPANPGRQQRVPEDDAGGGGKALTDRR